jgi:hypothetical protein
MSADDTDTDVVTAGKKGQSLTHKTKGVETQKPNDFDKKMKTKDKASEQMKKEFKK